MRTAYALTAPAGMESILPNLFGRAGGRAGRSNAALVAALANLTRQLVVIGAIAMRS
jgi:hypothetical protein